jgi:hypothetical protein
MEPVSNECSLVILGDVLPKIVNKLDSMKDVCSLRRTCSTLNEYVLNHRKNIHGISPFSFVKLFTRVKRTCEVMIEKKEDISNLMNLEGLILRFTTLESLQSLDIPFTVQSSLDIFLGMNYENHVFILQKDKYDPDMTILIGSNTPTNRVESQILFNILFKRIDTFVLEWESIIDLKNGDINDISDIENIDTTILAIPFEQSKILTIRIGSGAIFPPSLIYGITGFSEEVSFEKTMEFISNNDECLIKHYDITMKRAKLLIEKLFNLDTKIPIEVDLIEISLRTIYVHIIRLLRKYREENSHTKIINGGSFIVNMEDDDFNYLITHKTRLITTVKLGEPLDPNKFNIVRKVLILE